MCREIFKLENKYMKKNLFLFLLVSSAINSFAAAKKTANHSLEKKRAIFKRRIKHLTGQIRPRQCAGCASDVLTKYAIRYIGEELTEKYYCCIECKWDDVLERTL